jgi:TRAP-type transport system periplasmic protein
LAFISKKWFDALPSDLQAIIDTDALKVAAEINPWAVDFYQSQRKLWSEHGELISLPADEQADMMKSLADVGAEVAKRKPELEKAYNVFVEVAMRTAK